MGNTRLGGTKYISVLSLLMLLISFTTSTLFSQTALPELNYERLLSILSDHGWRVQLSAENKVLLMPPGQGSEQNTKSFNVIPEADSWRIEQAQDGTIFLFFNNAPLRTAKTNEALKASRTYTFEQLGELKERLVETGWKVEERQGNLLLYPNANAVVSAGNGDSDNRIAILPTPMAPRPSQIADASTAPPVTEVPAAASIPQVATPVPSDSDNDGVADQMDLCPKSKAETEVNSLGCDKSKSLVLEGVSFKSGSSALTAPSKKILDQHAEILNQHPSQNFKIIGHTDRTGSKSLNLDLSLSRAESVSAYFVDKKIDKNRIETEGKGESKPIASNKTKKGRLKNRRVELSF